MMVSFLFSTSLFAQSEKTPAKSNVFTVYTDESSVKWIGSKPLGEHFGTLNISEGALEFDNNELIGGHFVLDMESMKVDDIEDTEMNAKLLGHLKSADFFNVAEHPKAKFVISGARMVKGDGYNYEISGYLTIKDISHPVKFHAMAQQEGGVLKAHAPEFEIDRTRWDIQYKSKSFFDNLKDNFIYDEIGIEIHLMAN